MTGDRFAMDEQGFLFFFAERAISGFGTARRQTRAPSNGCCSTMMMSWQALVVPVTDGARQRVPNAEVVASADIPPDAAARLEPCRHPLALVATPASIELRQGLPRAFGGKACAQSLNYHHNQ